MFARILSPHRRRVVLRVAAVAAAGVVAFAAGFTEWRRATHNEGTVLPGELFRSAQLDGAEMSRFIQAHGVRTVINLRGENRGADWYTSETAACARLGVRHVDVRLSATQLPPPGEILKLLAAYREAPRPILLHCRSGSDRTGLATAIYLIDQKHLSYRQARGALSWEYGHFAVYPYFAMDEFIQLYGQSGASSLAAWAAEDYPRVYAAESREPRWHEVMEPLELAIKGSL